MCWRDGVWLFVANGFSKSPWHLSCYSNIPLMPPHAHSVRVTACRALFPRRFCSILFPFSESQPEGWISPAPLLREGQKPVAVHDIL